MKREIDLGAYITLFVLIIAALLRGRDWSPVDLLCVLAGYVLMDIVAALVPPRQRRR